MKQRENRGEKQGSFRFHLFLILTSVSLILSGCIGTVGGLTWNNNPFSLVITVSNPTSTNLSDYPVQVKITGQNFTSLSGAYGAPELEVADFLTAKQANYWVQEWNVISEVGIVWIKCPEIEGNGDAYFLIAKAASEANYGSGQNVFPFFEDGTNPALWSNTAGGGPSVTTGMQSYINITSNSTVVDDGNYNANPAMVKLPNGDILLTYVSGTMHVSVPYVMLVESKDNGRTWSTPRMIFDTSGMDPVIFEIPSGGLQLCFDKSQSGTGFIGMACMTSNDNGVTWTLPQFMTSNPYELFAVDQVVTVGSTLYASAYGQLSSPTGPVSVNLWVSYDFGNTWSILSNIVTSPSDPTCNESGLAYLGAQEFVVVLRSGSNSTTYERFSNDMGVTWGPLIDIGNQVGVLQYPTLQHLGNNLVLTAREAYERVPGTYSTSTRETAMFISSDEAKSFSDPTLVDRYTGQQIDGGYGQLIIVNNNQGLLTYYANLHTLRQPSIQFATINFGQYPLADQGVGISQYFENGFASRSFSPINGPYQVFASSIGFDAVNGNQLELSLLGESQNNLNTAVTIGTLLTPSGSVYPSNSIEFSNGSQLGSTLAAWQPSVNYDFSVTVNPSSDSIMAQVYNSDLVPEGTSFSGAIQSGTNGSLTGITLGSGTAAVDTLSDVPWIFVTPYAQSPPQVAISPD